MIEKTVLNYLKSAGITEVGTDVYMEVPVNPPSKYIVIEKTGSRKENGINRATMAIQSISSNSLLEAAEINEKVLEKIDSICATQDIFKAKLNSDYNFTNTQTKEYRYQAVFDFYY